MERQTRSGLHDASHARECRGRQLRTTAFRTRGPAPGRRSIRGHHCSPLTAGQCGRKNIRGMTMGPASSKYRCNPCSGSSAHLPAMLKLDRRADPSDDRRRPRPGDFVETSRAILHRAAGSRPGRNPWCRAGSVWPDRRLPCSVFKPQTSSPLRHVRGDGLFRFAAAAVVAVRHWFFSLLRRILEREERHEVGVMNDVGFRRAFDQVSFSRVRRDDVANRVGHTTLASPKLRR